MQKLQDSIFSIVKTTNLAPAVFSFLQPTEDYTDEAPLGGILKDTRHGWLALGPKFCVVDLRSGLKVAARTFGSTAGNSRITVTSVVELPTPLTDNSTQLIISLDYDNVSGMICVLHVNGSQILRCIQSEVVISELAVCDDTPEGPLAVFDNLVIAGTRRGEILVFDLNRASLIQALKDISQGYEHLVLNEESATNIKFLPLKNLHKIEQQRDLAIENNDHLGVILNEDSLFDGQYIFRNPEGTVRMKAKRDHIRVTSLQYIPQLGSLAVGYNFGAFQIWNLLNLDLEFTSQVNTECLPVTHFGFQEPCDDPRAFCYLWVIFSVIDRFDEEEFSLAVMYSLSYHGKRMLPDSKCLYQDFSSATIRFQVELCASEDVNYLLGGRCVSCHTYSIESPLGEEGEDSMLNICQLVWECWGENASTAAQYGMLLFDLDQWYKDQMPATYRLESSAFMSVTWLAALGSGRLVLDARLHPASVVQYSHATRLEEHFFPNSLQYNCVCLNTSEVNVLRTVGVQRQIITSVDEAGPTALLSPGRLYNACVTAGLSPLYTDVYTHSYDRNVSQEEQRRFLLSVALEGRLSRFLKRCAHDWATGTHSGLGCTLEFLVDWCWKRAIELKENAKELASPLFTSSTLPDRNIIRCLEHCVQQLTQLTGLLDAILTKCCNLVVPDALSEMEEKHKGVGTVSLYFQVVQWFLRVGLLPERHDAFGALPYPADQLYALYKKRRLKLHRLQNNAPEDEEAETKPCPLLYIDQLIEHEFDGQKVQEMWLKGGSECGGMYPPPSLYCLLRLYLLPDIAEEHKHSLVLYLLLDYSMHYDDLRYEAVIRRLMQFPTMFGLSNTAIKATQAFWHLDHRDFDFALDQLQCLTGNTLSEWQHSVVLTSLLAQKKSQAALQYLQVRKPAPGPGPARPARPADWRACCDLFLARGLLFEALDVVRTCVDSAPAADDKVHVLNFFFKGCRNTGQLSKIMQATLMPSEEEVFIKYLKDCNDAQTSDILIMYYLQQARYLEAREHNERLRESLGRELSTSAESLAELAERGLARDALVSAACFALPRVAHDVARTAALQLEPHVIAPKPMSVYVKAKSPKNTFTYKSSFIQDTIENASETWINRPKMRKGLKRALDIDNTPFICTPKLNRTKSLLSRVGEEASAEAGEEATPCKRAKLQPSPRSRAGAGSARRLGEQMAALLSMPDVHSPGYKYERSGAGTPQSILKSRRNEGLDREAASPVDSRYLADSDDELLETTSNHTYYSDSKQLRFTIPRESESGSDSRSPVPVALHRPDKDRDTPDIPEQQESPPMESPPKKLATEAKPQTRKTYKDSVRARRSLSISANSSLSDDPNASIESIADIPITLINPRYRLSASPIKDEVKNARENSSPKEPQPTKNDLEETSFETMQIPSTPKGRRGIREISAESTPRLNRNGSATPERQESPTLAALRASRATRSRSRTPEAALPPIPEQPRQELATEPHRADNALSLPRRLRSRSRTPDLLEKSVALPPTLEAITEAPTKSTDSEPESHSPVRRNLRSRSRTPDLSEKSVAQPPTLDAISESPTKSSNSESSSSPSRRSLRSRSRTPEVEKLPEPVISSPRSLRSRSKTPEKLMTPKKESAKARKPLSRLVLEANTFAKTKQITEEGKAEAKGTTETAETTIESTPVKTHKPTSLMDVTFSPIVNRSILQSSSDSLSVSEKVLKADESHASADLKPLPAFTTIHEVYTEKSILRSYHSSIETSTREEIKAVETTAESEIQSLPAFTINETDFNRSVLRSDDSSMAECSTGDGNKLEEMPKITEVFELKTLNETDFAKSVLGSHQSSVAECNESELAKSEIRDASSLLTSDSDFEKDLSSKWKYSENTARDIQKEKERIVEIEREINEIEEDFSEDSTDEEVVNVEDVEEEESSDTSDESSNDETSAPDSNEEIISIDDSDFEIETETQQDEIQQVDNVEAIASGSQTERIVEANAATNTETDIDANEFTNDAKTENKEENRNIENVEIEETNIFIVDKESVKDAESENQANLSLLTDDNSEVNLTYSDDSKDKVELKETEAVPVIENVLQLQPMVQVQVEVMVEPVTSVDDDKIEDCPADEDISENEPVTEQAIDVVDSSPVEVQPIDEKQTEEQSYKEKEDEEETKGEEIKEGSKEETKAEEINEGSIEKTNAEEINEESPKETKMEEIKEKSTKIDEIKEIPTKETKMEEIMEESTKETKMEEIMVESTKVTEMEEINEESTKVTEMEEIKEESKKESKTEEIKEESTKESKMEELKKESAKESKMEELKKESAKESKMEEIQEQSTKETKIEETKEESTKETKMEVVAEETKGTRPAKSTRKRSISTSSKTSKEVETVASDSIEKAIDSPKTPSRKRTQSSSSNKSTVEVTRSPEKEVLRQRRSKTPTIEVRKILTRRASKEMTEKKEPEPQLEESVTPRKRSTRTRSREVDDNTSVASDSSVRSNKGKSGEDLEGKPAPRKGRKSILNTKTDLSVIPEAPAEDSAIKETVEESVDESSTKKRVTRPRKSESWVQPATPRGRRASAASKASTASNASLRDDEDDADPLTLERIALLDKHSYEGPPDLEEMHRASPVTLISDVAIPRLARASSETKSVPTKKTTRRISVDITAIAEAGSPAEASPVRSRRASFNRACEALHTPKGKATPDAKQPKAEESSSIVGTPKRKPRRASVQSDVATPDADTGKRSRKTAADRAKESAE